MNAMIPTPAQYLLRFDDLCPTMSRTRWQRFLPLIEEFGIRPILAVIPDNRDRELELSPSDPEFWAQMRAMETAGATIALHGYNHLCMHKGKSLLPLHSRTEFAGVDKYIQQMWIRAGLDILRGHGLNPRLWVAPLHSFDCATLRALRKEGIKLLSDGFTRVPFSKGGLTWIPQQLWAPVEKPNGLWTICVHSNTARSSDVDRLQAFLRLHAQQFTSVERVMAEFRPMKLGLTERFYAGLALWRIRNRKALQWKLRRMRKAKA
jgi:predicted deacetylase